MKKHYLLLAFIFITSFSYAQAPFIMTYEISAAFVTITAPVMNDPDNNYTINFGDGTTLTNQTVQSTHTYINPGIYTITISGSFKRIFFPEYSGIMLKTIEQWGDNQWSSMSMAFFSCVNLTINATDAPDLSNVTDMSYMFTNCTSLNQSINNWDVSNVTDMSYLFSDATSFNQPLNNWDVSNVVNMESMFSGAVVFNQPLNNWDVGNVTNMSWLFYETPFNQPLNDWDVSSVENLNYLFGNNILFNQPLNNWDVSNVTDMSWMFYAAAAFNQPLNDWDISNVYNADYMFASATSFNQPLNNWELNEIDINSMFAGASSFNQPIGNWDLSEVSNLSSLFEAATSFNQPLNEWDMSNIVNTDNMFRDAISFNQPLDNWDMSNVHHATSMFFGANAFNQPINSWDMSACQSTGFMFHNATLFNQPLDNWNVSNVTFMDGMFNNATSFNQDISVWNFSNSVSLGSYSAGSYNQFFDNCGMDSNNYDAFLLKISQLEIIDKLLGAAGMEYCDQGVHDYLTNTLGWQIYQDSLGEGCGHNTFLGTVTYDENANGCDSNDMKAVNFLVSANNGSFNYTTSTNANGAYSINVLEGTFDVNILNVPEYYTVTPQESTVTFTGFGNEEAINFCLSANQSVQDLNITLLPLGAARPGFETQYQLVAQNMGTQTVTGATVSLTYNTAMQSFVVATPAETAATAGQLSFNLATLQPFESTAINLTMQTFTPPTVNGGDIAGFTATITPNLTDYTPIDNAFNLNQVVVNSFDPNDKQILQGEEITLNQAGGYLDYIIRFQNTGTASAINVRVADNLDPKLDWTTLMPVGASHSYTVQITEANQVEFIFNNINLPQEAADANGSHGFIAYKIKPQQNVAVGDIISGNAGIYFDFNEPIITNIATTEIISNLGVKDNVAGSVVLYPNPAHSVLNLKTANGIEVKSVSVYNLQGGQLLSLNSKLETIDIESLSAGVYLVAVKTNQGMAQYKLIKK